MQKEIENIINWIVDQTLSIDGGKGEYSEMIKEAVIKIQSLSPSTDSSEVSEIKDDDEFEFVFKNDEGREMKSTLTGKRIMDLVIDDAFEHLDQSSCNESTCQVNGFCECGGDYDDYSFKHLSIMRSKLKSQWVSVEDRLPEEGNWYLVIERGQVNFLFYDSEKIWLSTEPTESGSCEWRFPITHWQHLPTLPESPIK